MLAGVLVKPWTSITATGPPSWRMGSAPGISGTASSCHAAGAAVEGIGGSWPVRRSRLGTVPPTVARRCRRVRRVSSTVAATADADASRTGLAEGVRLFYWVLKSIVLGPVLRAIFRPWVTGLENVPEKGPAILVSNHLSFSDSFFLPLVVPRRITFLAKADYFTGRGVKGRLTAGLLPRRRPGAGRPLGRRRRRRRPAHRPARARPGRPARHLPRGHPQPRRPALPRQDRRGADGARGPRAGDPRGDGRHRQGPADRAEGAPTSDASACGSARRSTSPGTRGWSPTGWCCARSPTR